VLISVSFVTAVFAQTPAEKATKAATDTAKEQAQATGDTMKDKATKAARPANVKAMKTKGEVVKISEEEGIIVVKGKKGDETYDIKEVKWAVYKDAKEVKTGEVVVISYINKDGKKVAKVVGKSKSIKKAAPKVDKPAVPAPAAAPAAPAPSTK
jgi:hypothetical protein